MRAPSRREATLRAALLLSSVLVALLLFEGAVAVLQGRGVLFRLLRVASRDLVLQPAPPFPGAEAPRLGDHPAVPLPEHYGYLTSESELQGLQDALKREGVLLGNTPLDELASGPARATYVAENGMRRLVPSASFEFGYIRSFLYWGWDPVCFTRRAELPVRDRRVAEFLDRKAHALTHMSHDAEGNRVTPPKVASGPVVLVVGDSVAYGAGVADGETIAGHLQRAHPELRVVNAGIPGANTDDILSRLAELLDRHAGSVHAVVYVHCQNDFSERETPETISGRLADLLAAHHVVRSYLVNHLYVYQAMPDVIRPDPRELVRIRSLVEKLATLARQRGIAVVDFASVLEKHRYAAGNPFAGFALYVDHCHFSSLGNELVSREIGL